MSPKVADSVKKLRGTFQKSRSNPRAPKPEPVTIGPPPPELADDEAEVWTGLAAALNPLHVVGAGDLVAFGLAVSAVTLAKRTTADPKASANQKIRASAAAGSWLARFGLVPDARTKVSAAPVTKAVDPIDEFLPPWTMPQA